MHLVNDGRALDTISDAVDEGSCACPILPSHRAPLSVADRCLPLPLSVNKLKGKGAKWDERSKFDAEKDKNNFRQYEEACDRVKNFYREQHGEFRVAPLLCTAAEMTRVARG